MVDRRQRRVVPQPRPRQGDARQVGHRLAGGHQDPRRRDEGEAGRRGGPGRGEVTLEASPDLLFGAAAAAMLAATFAWLLRPLWARHGRVLLVAAAVVPVAAAALYAILGNLRAVDERHTVDAATAAKTVPAGVLRADL